MKELAKKRIAFPIICVLSFVLSFLIFFVNSSNIYVYADTAYSQGVEEIKFKTASSD